MKENNIRPNTSTYSLAMKVGIRCEALFPCCECSTSFQRLLPEPGRLKVACWGSQPTVTTILKDAVSLAKFSRKFAANFCKMLIKITNMSFTSLKFLEKNDSICFLP